MWGGAAAVVSRFPEAGESIYFPRLYICMLKSCSAFVGRIYLGCIFYLTEQSAGRGLSVKEKATSSRLPPSFYATVPSLAQSIREARAGFLPRCAEWWRVAPGRSPLRLGCQARWREGPSTRRETLSARGATHISPHVTDLNIDNDFKGGKLHILLYPQMPRSSSNKPWRRGTIAGQSDGKGAGDRGVLERWL